MNQIDVIEEMEVRELTMDELEQVAGGPGPLILIPIYLAGVGAGAGTVVGTVALARAVL